MCTLVSNDYSEFIGAYLYLIYLIICSCDYFIPFWRLSGINGILHNIRDVLSICLLSKAHQYSLLCLSLEHTLCDSWYLILYFITKFNFKTLWSYIPACFDKRFWPMQHTVDSKLEGKGSRPSYGSFEHTDHDELLIPVLTKYIMTMFNVFHYIIFFLFFSNHFLYILPPWLCLSLISCINLGQFLCIKIWGACRCTLHTLFMVSITTWLCI